MAKLIYVTNVSLDGYIEDARGNFDWTEPTDEYFAFITDLVRPVGTYLYGRRLYQSMAVWETEPTLAAQSQLYADFANVWQTADRIVCSTTLHAVSTRLERRCDPDSVRVRPVAPVDRERKRMAFELLGDIRRLDTQHATIKDRIATAVDGLGHHRHRDPWRRTAVRKFGSRTRASSVVLARIRAKLSAIW